MRIHITCIAAVVLIVAAGLAWVACQPDQGTVPTAALPAAESAAASGAAEPVPIVAAQSTALVTDVAIAKAHMEIQAAIAKMRQEGVAESVIATREAHAAALLENARNGTWHPTRTPEEYLEIVEAGLALGVERGLLTQAEADEKLEAFREAQSQ